MVEEWRPIVGFEDRYEVSSHGRVRSLRTRGKWHDIERDSPLILRPSDGGRKFLYVIAGRKPRRIHVLVCTAFNGQKPSAKHHAAHLDGDSYNNHASNLAWVTPKENERQKIAHGTYNHVGSKNPPAILTETQAQEIKSAFCPNPGDARRLAEKFGVSPSTVSSIRTGFRWKHLPTEQKR